MYERARHAGGRKENINWRGLRIANRRYGLFWRRGSILETYYVSLEIQYIYMYYVYFISVLYGLLIDVQFVKITWTDTIRAYIKFENSNKDISLNISLNDVDEGHLKRRLSHFFFIKSRK